jgi:ribosomal silencing factor RsfS
LRAAVQAREEVADREVAAYQDAPAEKPAIIATGDWVTTDANVALRPVAVDGFPASQWMVLDYLQVVVHIFHHDKRPFYSLEALWGDAPVLQWESISTR